MPDKRQVLDLLTRSELQSICDRFELTVTDRRVRDALVDALTSSKRATLAHVLPELSRDRLKQLCAALGLDDGGREKALLIDRLAGKLAATNGTNGTLPLFERGEPTATRPLPTKPMTIPTPPPPSPRTFTGFSEIASFLWSVADLLRGDYKQADYGKVILPMTVLRRLDCVLAPTKEKVLARSEELKKKKDSETIAEKLLLHTSRLGLYNVSRFDFEKLKGDPPHIRLNLLDYIRGFSTNARDVFDRFKFEDQIDKLEESNLLYEVVSRFAAVDLHPDRVPNHAMGSIFEELIRRFAEQSNETAGEHFTPREVIRLMVDLLFIEDDEALHKPGIIRTLFDPACGTGGMLSVAEERLRELNPDAELQVFGQELNDESYAICKSDMVIKGHVAGNIARGNSFSEDAFIGRQFDYMLSNPPFGVEWKKIEKAVREEHEQQGMKGRFGAGLPRINDGSLLFIQQMLKKMKPAEAGGSRLAIVFNGSPLFTGDAGSGESEIRRWVIENDWLEAIIALPDQLFFNTGICTYIWMLTNRKPRARTGKVQLINGVEPVLLAHRAVYYVLTGQKDAWVELAVPDTRANDWPRILAWIERRFRWGTDPGSIAEPDAQARLRALRNFKTRYDEEVARLSRAEGGNPFQPLFTTKWVQSEGGVGPKTWGAFFDMYMRALMVEVRVPTVSALLQRQAEIRTVAPAPTQGCGKNHPKNLEERKKRRLAVYPDVRGDANPADRRVELLFLDPGEAPPFPCHPGLDVESCKPALCQLYDDKRFVQRRIPVGRVPRVKITLTSIEVSRVNDDDDKAEWVDQRDFAPVLGERVRFHLHIERMRTPFQGRVWLNVGRYTKDGSDAVAQLTAELCSPSPTADLVIEWDGKATLDVPRKFSDRAVRSETTGQLMSVPMHERKAGERLRHGLYMIQEIGAQENDDSIAGSNDDVDGQLSVPLVCAFRSFTYRPPLEPGGAPSLDGGQEFAESLNAYGFEYPDAQARAVAFRPLFEGAIVAGLRHLLGLDDLDPKQRPNLRLRLDKDMVSPFRNDRGIVAECQVTTLGRGDTRFVPAGRNQGPGLDLGINMFAFFGDGIRCATYLTTLFPSDTYKNPVQDPLFREIFGPLGVPTNSKQDFLKGPAARRVGPSGDVTGMVTRAGDVHNVRATIGSTGLVTIESTDLTVVPSARAAQIQRAIRAIVHYAAYTLAHEIGHALGLVASPMNGRNANDTEQQITVDGVRATTPFDAERTGNHSKHATPGELMAEGNQVTEFRALIGEAGPPLSFRASYRTYLGTVTPFAR